MTKQYGTPGPRAIWPDMVRSRSLARCGLVANAVWPRLVALADDQGRLMGDAAELYPLVAANIMRHTTLGDFTEAMAQLQAAKMLRQYTVQGDPYVQLLEWWRWQAGQRRAYPSRYPPPRGWQDYVYGLPGTPPERQVTPPVKRRRKLPHVAAISGTLRPYARARDAVAFTMPLPLPRASAREAEGADQPTPALATPDGAARAVNGAGPIVASLAQRYLDDPAATPAQKRTAKALLEHQRPTEEVQPDG